MLVGNQNVSRIHIIHICHQLDMLVKLTHTLNELPE